MIALEKSGGGNDGLGEEQEPTAKKHDGRFSTRQALFVAPLAAPINPPRFSGD